MSNMYLIGTKKEHHGDLYNHMVDHGYFKNHGTDLVMSHDAHILRNIINNPPMSSIYKIASEMLEIDSHGLCIDYFPQKCSNCLHYTLTMIPVGGGLPDSLSYVCDYQRGSLLQIPNCQLYCPKPSSTIPICLQRMNKQFGSNTQIEKVWL